jgi:IS30 family transposase
MTARKFTAEDIKYLEENSATVARSDLARHLGRERSSVSGFLKRAGLPMYNGKHRRWTKKEVSELFDLVERFGHKEIALKLGRHPQSVSTKIKALGLTTRTEVYSLYRAAKETGYYETMFKRAKRALGQKWVRTSHGQGVHKMHRYTITKVQLQRLCDWLRDN